MRVVLLAISIILYNDIHQTNSTPLCKIPGQLIDDINNVLGFLERNYREINLDGWFGYKALEKFVGLIKEEALTNCNLSPYIKAISQRVATLNKLALKAAYVQQPKYVNQVKRAIDQFLILKPVWTHIQKKANAASNSNSQNIDYNEEIGDACFNELVARDCRITIKCFRMFLLDDRTANYRATHKAMYLSIYEQMKCYENYEHRLSRIDLDRLIIRTCAGMLQENVDLLQSNRFNISQNLNQLLERIVICGGKLGFVDFFTKLALETIRLSIDVKDGCIRSEAYLSNSKKALRGHENIQIDETLEMKKKRESIMKDGCSSHLIGAGAAGLGAFLHYTLSRDSTGK